MAYEYIHIMNLKSMFIFFSVYVQIHFLKKFEIVGLVFEKIQSVRRLPFKRCKMYSIFLWFIWPLMRVFKAETMVSTIFSLSYECILSLKGSEIFILMIIKYVNLQNIFWRSLILKRYI